jgi:hypothetical protein
VHGELLLPDATQIAGADVVANPRQLKRSLVLGRCPGEHLLTPAGRGLGGESVLDLCERPGADPAVVRDGLALLGGSGSGPASSVRPPVNNGANRLPPALQTGLSRSWSTNSSLVMSLTDPVSLIVGRRAAFASSSEGTR